MKRAISLLILIIAMVCSGFSQTDELKPVVIRANYFDVSVPLRDMMVSPALKFDQSWKDGVVKNNLYPKEIFPNPTDVYQTDPQSTQTWRGLLTNDTIVQNFDGLSTSGAVPPDTDGDAGPDHYFAVVNISYAIFNKSGNKILGPRTNSTIFQGMPNNSNDGDAIVLYDEQADRWLFSQFSLPNYPNGPFYENVAISQTPDPTGSWYRYQFQFSSMPDYPKLSVWEDGYYMTCNRFSSGGLNYSGTGYVAMDRTKMLQGDATASMIYFTLPGSNSAYSVLPADCDGPFPPAGTPCYFAFTNPSYVAVYEFHADFANPSNSTYTLATTLPVNSFNGTVNGIPQKGTSVKLDAISGRLMYRLQFRKFSDHWSMVASGTVNASGIASIRWYEFRKSGSNPWSVYQQSTYNPDNSHRWMGSIAMDSTGNIALGYSVSSSTMYPSIRFTGRMANDPLNTMTISETTIIDGGGAQTGVWGGRSRWGDYSKMSADPVLPNTFWYTQEYYKSTSQGSWSTRIASFSFGNLFTSYATAYPTPVCAGDSTQLQSIAYGGSGNYTYSWSSDPAGFSSNIKNPKAAPSEDTKYIVEVSDGSEAHHDTADVNVIQPPVCFAGNDVYITSPVPPSIDLHGTAGNYKMVGWDSNGDGYFSDPDTLNTQYIFGPNDTIAGNTIEIMLVALPIAPCHGNATSTMHIYFFPVGIGESGISSLKVYPNPATENLNVEFALHEMQSVRLDLLTIQGTVAYTETFAGVRNDFKKSIDLTRLAKGMYMLKITTDKGTASSKVIIE